MVASRQPLPAYRKHSSSSRYYATPFNFPWYTAYTEVYFKQQLSGVSTVCFL